MDHPHHHDWSTQQLAEFLVAVSAFRDEDSALLGAVERAAEAVEAEVAAVVRGDEVAASLGFPAGKEPTDELVAVGRGDRDHVEVAGMGRCPAIAVPLEWGERSHLLLARAGEEGFSREEASLLS